jgi:hypothetical protein
VLKPALETRPARRLPAQRQLRCGQAGHELAQLRQPPSGDAAREHDPFRRRQNRPPRLHPPTPPVRREDAKSFAADRGRLARRDDRHAGECLELDPLASETQPKPPLPLLRVTAHVLTHEHALGLHIPHGPHSLLDDVPTPKGKLAASSAERAAEGPQRAEQKHDTIRRAERPQQPAVEHEERKHALEPPDRGGQSRIVVDAQIAGEQDDRGTLQMLLHIRTKSTPGYSQPDARPTVQRQLRRRDSNRRTRHPRRIYA